MEKPDANFLSIPQWCDCCANIESDYNPRTIFQSHNGAIAALPKVGGITFEPWFQSHNGAIAAFSCVNPVGVIGLLSIPQWCDCCLTQVDAWTTITPFNPTMVRLLPMLVTALGDGVTSFQSHNGAIAAIFSPPIYAAVVCFQSHNGAIAAQQARYVLDAVFQLSIPQWCDCCQGKILGFEGKREGNGEGVAVDLRLPENP